MNAARRGDAMKAGQPIGDNPSACTEVELRPGGDFGETEALDDGELQEQRVSLLVGLDGGDKPISPSPLIQGVKALVSGAVEREEFVEADSFLKLYRVARHGHFLFLSLIYMAIRYTKSSLDSRVIRNIIADTCPRSPSVPFEDARARFLLERRRVQQPAVGPEIVDSPAVLLGRVLPHVALEDLAVVSNLLDDPVGPFVVESERIVELGLGAQQAGDVGIGLTGSGSGAVQREIKHLSSSGLVNVSLTGKRKHYQANHESPVFEELRRLVVKTVAGLQAVRQALEPLADRVSLALIYGSVASGTDTASSDIDLLIVADDLTLEDVYSALIPVEADLDRRIHPTLYTSREFADRKGAHSGFLTSVLGGDRLVLIERKGAATAA